jgi:hypothetical protein
MIIQLSIFLRNQPGELKNVTGLLAENNIQIRAVTVAETADYGILRCIVNDPEAAYTLLKENNILVGKTEVMAIQMEDKPGGLHKIATILGDAGVNIEYFYAFAIETKAILVLQVSQAHVEMAQSVLAENEILELAPDEIYSL